MLLCNQHETLKCLFKKMIAKTGAVGIFFEVQRSIMEKAAHDLSGSGNYSVFLAATLEINKDKAMSAKECHDALDSDKCDIQFRSNSSVILGLVPGISADVAGRVEDSESHFNVASKVLPHYLIHILPRNSSWILQCYRECLEVSFSTGDIEMTGSQHKALRESYQRKHNLRSSTDSSDGASSYHDAWIGSPVLYSFLEKFNESLAANCSRTATVESDFSVAKYEKAKRRMSLMDISLEAILHANGYRRMRTLIV